MAENVKKIADALGASIVAQLPETGGGAFGAARLVAIVEELKQARSVDRPYHTTVPMSEVTHQKLSRLAQQVSTEAQVVTPSQLAAQLLEDLVGQIQENAD